jgi:eukaryotic-like serine/threonine-protein kinase
MNPDTPSFKKYRIVAKLDSGGMADVYLCLAKGPAGFNKLHVVKQLRSELADNETLVGMFLDEARLAARLNHPNVVQTNEVGQEDDRYYLAMEYIEGRSLSRLLRMHLKKKGTALPLEIHLRILCDAMSGLHYAHELRNYDGKPLDIVHRDVSPQNVFIAYAGNVKLLDFGIAKANLRRGVTEAGTIKGKIAFMSPEQIRSSEAIDRRADVFSAGVMLWDAVVGKPLLDGLTDVERLRRVCTGALPSPREAREDVPAELDRICARAIAFDPTDRYATVAELRAEVETYLAGIGSKVSAEDVGKIIEELFGDERARIERAIDEHIRRLEAEPDVSHTPLTLASSPGTRSLSSAAPATGQGVAMTLGGDRERVRSFGLLAIAATMAFVIGAVALRQVWPKPPEVAVATAGLAAPRVDDVVIVDVRVTPPQATLYLDDVPLDGNPYVGRQPRSHTPRTLRIALPDGTEQTRMLTFDEDLRLELALAPDRPQAAAAAPAAAPPTSRRALSYGAGIARQPPPAAPSADPVPRTPSSAPAPPPVESTEPPAALPPMTTRSAKPRPTLDKIDL